MKSCWNLSIFFQGLAYVNFVDDEDLAAAIAKNIKMFLGKKISIERSNPKKGKKKISVGVESVSLPGFPQSLVFILHLVQRILAWYDCFHRRFEEFKGHISRF
ncbi:unnamed protein product [Brassica rapa subsp. trilocularis]